MVARPLDVLRALPARFAAYAANIAAHQVRTRPTNPLISPPEILNLAKLFCLLSRLPLSMLHLIGGWVGRVFWLLSAAFRDEVRRNLGRALGHEPSRQQLLRVAEETGRQMLELPWVWLRPQEEVLSRIVQVEGGELLAQARQDGASVLLLTPHLGCFEMCAQYCSTHGPITVLFRPPRKASLAPIMEAGRARGNVQVAPADVSGVRRLVKALRSGEMVGMLPDQAPKQGEGVWAPFFGKPAWTMTLAARLSEVKGVRVIMIWAERLPRGRGYALHLSEPVAPIEGDLEARCVAVNREIEQLIMRCPEQYLWGYKRYKRPSGVPEPGAEAE